MVAYVIEPGGTGTSIFYSYFLVAVVNLMYSLVYELPLDSCVDRQLPRPIINCAFL